MMLRNKIALVTGASRGIGKAILIKLAKSGAVVIGVDFRDEYANSITVFLKKMKLDGEGFLMDVTDQNSIEKKMAEINKKYGYPSILVNNAGINRDNLMIRMSQDEWDQVIETNLTSIFRLSKFCIRGMIKARFGRIINIVSIVAYTGNAGQTNYSASKAGIIALSKSLAREVASRNITVNNVAPGYIESEMTSKLTYKQRDRILSLIPMNVIGSPGDVANVVEFLAGNGASYITGSTVHVNGGMLMI